MKKIICLVLCVCLFSACTVFADAMPKETKSELAVSAERWGYVPGGEPVCIDSFEAEHYTISLHYDGSTIYSITVLENGDTEFSWLAEGGNVRSIDFSTADLNIAGRRDFLSLAIDEAFVSEAKSFAFENAERSEISIEAEEQEVRNTRASNAQLITYFENQIRAIHGIEHTGTDWTGLGNHVYNGLTFNFKEDLDIGVMYRDSEAYTEGMRLGALVINIANKIPSVSIGAIATVLNMAASYNAYLVRSGVISAYYGDAIFNRYVKINGGGPYYQCFRTVYYDGWVDNNDISTAHMTYCDQLYNPNSPEIFNSYVQQRNNAYNNY